MKRSAYEKLKAFIILICIVFIIGCGKDDKKPADQVTQKTEYEDESINEISSDDLTKVNTKPEDDTVQQNQVDEAPLDVEDNDKQSLNIIMVGDILLHTPVEEAAKDDETGNYDFSFIFDNTRDRINAADIAIVNQEVIIGGEALGISGYPTFNAPFEIGDALNDAGFDVVCHATNHALDRGKNGIINCLDFWRTKYPDMLITGIYDNEEDASAESIPVIEKNGIKIAILNYTYGTNGIEAPSDMPYAVSMLRKERVVAQLDKAEQIADFTIVCPHWGTEYNLGISSEQKKWTEIFREHGADAVIGTHPHVIEPLVFLEDEDTDNITNNHGNGDMPVYYSLGNFVNWTAGTGTGVANRMVGGMASINISRKDDKEVSIDDFNVESYVCHVKSGDGNVTVYPLIDYSEQMAFENEIRIQDSSFSKEYCDRLVEKVYGDQ